MEVAHHELQHTGPHNGFGRSSGGKQPRQDRRPAALINDPAAFKKCGHCQEMKACVEFSADVSRGDGLRGWCKLCEAEARSNRYKKRKAVALESSAARRRLEQPLGGLQQFHVSQAADREPSPPPLHLQHHEDPAAAAAAHHQQQRQALEAQMVAHLQQQPLPPQHPHQQQQQQPLDIGFLQHQLALWQAQRDAAAQAEAQAAQAALAASRQSAFHATASSTAPSAGPPATFGLGGSSAQDAAAAYLAAAAAGAHMLQLGAPGHPPPHAQAAAARAKFAARSPDTSDSDTDAAAALTGMKRGQLLRSPARRAAGTEQLWRTSAGSEDSAATASMTSLPQPAPPLQPVPATAPAPRLWPAAASHPAAALAVQHSAPLPPCDQPYIPRRSRTRAMPPVNADGTATARTLALAGPLVSFQPPSGDPEEIKQWSSRILAMMLVLRAAGHRA